MHLHPLSATTNYPSQPGVTLNTSLIDPSTTQLIDLNRSIKMNLMHEDLARAHMEARLSEARELRRSYQLSKSRRLARRAERAQQQAHLLLARAL